MKKKEIKKEEKEIKETKEKTGKENKKSMSSINKFIVMGRLTKDPELKTTEKGNKVVNVTLALDRNYRDKDGNKVTDFLNFTLWDKNAERICELSKKGALVSFEGYNRAQEIETKEGYKGGIYTPLSWDSKSGWKDDMDTFIFNLNKNQKYKKIINEKSIRCGNDYGPWTTCFGFFQENQMMKIRHQGLDINSYYDGGAEILPNNTWNTKYFDIIEVEIYKILF